MTSSALPNDRARTIAVLVTAVAQVASGPLSLLALGPASNQATISNANLSPVTPAGYAFSIWGLIYLMSLVLAVYQALPSQRTREVHRRSGWWLAAAFTASAIWVPIFGLQLIWLAQVVILGLVAALTMAVRAMRSSGPTQSRAEQFCLRLAATVYLGWALCASAAGFGLTFRWFGMPERAGWVTAVSIGLVTAATVIAALLVTRQTALAGFTFTVAWALVGVAVGTYEAPVRVVALLAIAVVIGVLVARTAKARDRSVILLG